MRNDALFRKFTAFASACAVAMLTSAAPVQKKSKSSVNVVVCGVISDDDMSDSAEADSQPQDYSKAYPRLFERISAKLRKIRMMLIMAVYSLSGTDNGYSRSTVIFKENAISYSRMECKTHSRLSLKLHDPCVNVGRSNASVPPFGCRPTPA